MAITIALKEEFDAILPLLPQTQRHQIAGSEHMEYYSKIEAGARPPINMMIALVDDMGDLDAGLVTMNYMVRTTTVPKLIVSLGIAGSMDKKLLLNDVIIANSVDRYMSKSKAIPSASNNGPFVPQHGGHVLPVCGRCAGFATDFNRQNKRAVEDWQVEGWADLEASISRGVYEQIKAERFVEDWPKIMVGTVACGPTVSAAEGFTTWIKDRERGISAIDMESGGVFKHGSEVYPNADHRTCW